MVFNSFEFLLFLPIVFVAYWILAPKVKIQNAFVILASYFFYGYWNWRFLLLIAFTTICSYYSGILLKHLPDDKRPWRLTVVWGNAAINLGILGVFKYYDFFVSSLQQLLQRVGIELGDLTLNLVLPVGISFYTFQALSYTIDVYRKKTETSEDPLAFCAFLSFFPQLVAGPIERSQNLLPQFMHRRHFTYDDGVEGARLMLWGLFKKVVVADNCGFFVNQIFPNYANSNVPTLACAVLLFSFQIYGDFSGYSDIARGLGRWFGIRLSQNFATPYFAKSIPEFWSRWHMTLSTWFRDYVYIPLGGGRVGTHKKARNIMVTFLFSGIWHGANITYALWGVMHGVFNLPYVYTKKKPDRTIAGKKGWFPSLGEFRAIAFTFILVALARVLYRADSIGDAFHYLGRMLFSFDFSGETILGAKAIFWCIVLVIADWVQRRKECPLQFSGHGLMRYRWARWLVYYALIAAILLFPGASSQFIYFQF